MCSAIGFIIGLALFGSVTYLPLFFQVVKGMSPTSSGLQLTPLMAGLLVTSIVSGQLITRFGRYRPFPIAGTAVMAVAMVLLATLAFGTPVWVSLVYMVVLGLGLGMVMQVLVLAVQNAIEPENVGVGTAGSTLFRQVGGSIGVSLFGAIFANRLNVELGRRLPAHARIPKTTNPAALRHLPPAVHDAFAHAIAAALHPVFTVAAAISVVAFALTWLLQDVPLRMTPRAGAAIPAPAEEDSAQVAVSS